MISGSRQLRLHEHIFEKIENLINSDKKNLLHLVESIISPINAKRGHCFWGVFNNLDVEIDEFRSAKHSVLWQGLQSNDCVLWKEQPKTIMVEMTKGLQTKPINS